MKSNIHPQYNKITVRLSDGTTYESYSTMKAAEYVPDVDSTNHPFYTGKKQFLDTAGRVEKFNRRYGKKSAVEPEAAPEAAAEVPAATE